MNIVKMLLLAFALMLVPQMVRAQTPPRGPAPTAAYVLGPDDVIEVEVLGQADFGKPRVRIKSDGTVPLPVVGTLTAGGLSTTELASAIQRKLVDAQYYANPSVNVEVVGFASSYVIVLGAVAQPGLVPINRAYRVSEILARVGGVKESSGDYVVLSSAKGTERKIPIVGLSRNGPNDPFVAADDKLFVPEAESFYIYGQVNAPGAYMLKNGMTLRQALARGGGLTSSGSEKKVSVYRGEQKMKLALDTKLLPGDVVVVGERLF